MDFQIVMELSAVATIIGVIVSYFTFHKTSKLSYITQERKEWRADIRKIVDELEVCPFSKKKRVLTKLKTRINTYGKLTEDVGKDSHIWKQIEIIENCRAKEYEKQKDKLILFLSLLLKDDWERAKKEVIGEPAKGIITVCLSFAIIFSWIGIFQANGINIRDVKEVQKGIIYTSPGMILIIMGLIGCFLMINVLKQHCEGEIVVIDVIWTTALIFGVLILTFGNKLSIFIQAAIGMIIFSGVLSLLLDIGKYVQGKRYKSYVDKIKGDEKAVQNS